MAGRKQYCFDVIEGDIRNVDALLGYIRKLYIGKKEPYFEEGSAPLTAVFHSDSSPKSACIILTPAGKKNTERVEKINKLITPRKLKWDGLTLSKPHLYAPDVYTWRPEDSVDRRSGEVWRTLEHNGPYFSHLDVPYVPVGVSLEYEGERYPLNPKEEMWAMEYARRKLSERRAREKGKKMQTEGTDNKDYRKNFWMDYKKILRPEYRKRIKSFDKIGWNDAVNKEEERQEAKKSRGKAEKDAELARKVVIERKHKYAKLDGHVEEVGNFSVEQGGILQGRGNNPDFGRIKHLIMPEDVTINIGEGAPIPVPPSGHRWGGVVNDHTAEWLATYKDPISGGNKYIRFAASGVFKGQNDLVKYEKARKLAQYIDVVRRNYMSLVSSSNEAYRQLGVALYLIDFFGLRVGGSDKEESDVVGCTTLKVGNVKFPTDSPDRVSLDFVGKDSVRFDKDLDLPNDIYKLLKSFVRGKSAKDYIFDKITDKTVNDYLKTIDADFTAKLFRTRLGSTTMFDQLTTLQNGLDDGSIRVAKSNLPKIKTLFIKANTVVAKTLNHVKNAASSTAKDSIAKEKAKLAEMRKELREKRMSDKKRAALKVRIDKKKDQIALKTDALDSSIGTSQQNYIDPRIPTAWAEGMDYKLDDFYPKKLADRFSWAQVSTPEGWNYLESPLEGVNPRLAPAGTRPQPERPTKSRKKIVTIPESGSDSDDEPLISRVKKRKSLTRSRTTTKIVDSVKFLEALRSILNLCAAAENPDGGVGLAVEISALDDGCRELAYNLCSIALRDSTITGTGNVILEALKEESDSDSDDDVPLLQRYKKVKKASEETDSDDDVPLFQRYKKVKKASEETDSDSDDDVPLFQRYKKVKASTDTDRRRTKKRRKPSKIADRQRLKIKEVGSLAGTMQRHKYFFSRSADPGAKLLSNFAPTPVQLNGRNYPTGEHALHGAKFLAAADSQEGERARNLTAHAAEFETGGKIGNNPVDAKKNGRALKLNDNELAHWNSSREDVQRQISDDKFARYPDVRAALRATHGQNLIHFSKGAKPQSFWEGKIDKTSGELVGNNKLGKIWMDVRDSDTGTDP